MELCDYQIRNLIGTARKILKMKRELYNEYYSHEDWHTRINPAETYHLYSEYLTLKHIVNDLMKKRRNHRINSAFCFSKLVPAEFRWPIQPKPVMVAGRNINVDSLD